MTITEQSKTGEAGRKTLLRVPTRGHLNWRPS
jgi:hypothetical protein